MINLYIINTDIRINTFIKRIMMIKKIYTVLLSLLCGGIIHVHAQKLISINEEGAVSKYFRSAGAKNSVFEDAERYREFSYNPALKTMSAENKRDTLLLDFFADKQYKAVVKNVTISNDGVIGITARIVDSEFAYCYMSVSPSGISIMAELPLLNEQYFVAKTQGMTYLSQYNLSKKREKDAIECTGDHTPDANTKVTHQSDVPSSDMVAGNVFQVENLPESCPKPSLDASTQIDVMIVYTAKAAQWAINDYQVTDIHHLINIAMQKANEAMVNSETNITFNLVHKYQTSYEEVNSSQDLYWITNGADEESAKIHALRKQYSADMVVLMPEVDFTGGLAWLLNNENGSAGNAFSLSRVQQSSWTYTMVHEIGHNMGCGHHNRQLTQAGPGLYPYSGGWRGITNAGTKYSTIMTYEAASYFPGETDYYPRIPYFSSPDLTFEGVSVGNVDEANNALTIKQVKYVTSKYSEADQQLYISVYSVGYTYGSNNTTHYYDIRSGSLEDGDEVRILREAGTDAGTYAVTARIYRGEADVTCLYDSRVSDGTITINKRTPYLYLNNQTVTYTGERIDIGTLTTYSVVSGDTLGVTYEYTKDGVTTDSVTNAGVYSVQALLKDHKNYNDATSSSVTFTIKKAIPVITLLSKTVSYTGNAVEIDEPEIEGGTAKRDLTFVTEYEGVNGTVYAKTQTAPSAVGEYKVTVSTSGDDNHEAVTESTTLTIGTTTSIDVENSEQNRVIITPNPVNKGNAVTVSLPGGDFTAANIYIEVYSLSGQLVGEQKATGRQISVGLPAVSGTYIIKVRSDKNHIATEQVVVK